MAEAITVDRLIGLAGVIAGIAGVVVAVVVYLRQRHEKRPVWTVLHTPLVTPAFQRSGLELRFEHVALDVASRAEITFWNAGNDVIWEEDLSDEHPLRIEPHPRVDILSYELLVEPKDRDGRSKLSLLPKAPLGSKVGLKEIEISFTNLRPNEGAVISVIHTGTSASDIRLESGRITGALPLEERQSSDVPDYFLSPWAFLLTGVAVGAEIAPLFLIVSWAQDRLPYWLGLLVALGVVVVALGLPIVVAVLTNAFLRRGGPRIPQALRRHLI